jgi:hypothetical protein
MPMSASPDERKICVNPKIQNEALPGFVVFLFAGRYSAIDAAWTDHEFQTCRILMPKASLPRSSGSAYFSLRCLLRTAVSGSVGGEPQMPSFMRTESRRSGLHRSVRTRIEFERLRLTSSDAARNSRHRLSVALPPARDRMVVATIFFDGVGHRRGLMSRQRNTGGGHDSRDGEIFQFTKRLRFHQP